MIRYDNKVPVSTDSLIHDITDWLVREVEKRQQTDQTTTKERAPSNEQAKKSQGLFSLDFFNRDKTPSNPRHSSSARTALSIDRQSIQRNALRNINQYLTNNKSASRFGEKELEAIVKDICEELNSFTSDNLAHAWIHKKPAALKGDDGVSTDLIAVAVAALVSALVLLARRKSSVKAHETEFGVSKDFKALQRVRDDGGDAAKLASQIIEQERSPGDFSLEQGLKRLANDAEKRMLFSALKSLDIGVEVISPKGGDRFEDMQMCSDLVVADGSKWLVAESVSAEKIGFKQHNKVLVKADVEACTADWWCVALADEGCPVAQQVREAPEQYVGVEARYASCWTIDQGFSAFADLRSELDEETLVSWRDALKARLREHYPADNTRIPEDIGAEGARYDASVMQAVGEPPQADAKVATIEERDGYPQVGFGCKNAPPLLYAIVRVEEV